jgi:uncharacterized protein YecT (DUF1311 family)
MCGSVSAQVPSEVAIIDAKLEACLVKADGVTPGIDNCNERAKISADLILNRIYGDWVEQLKHPAKDNSENAEILKRLIASERAWITYRDTNCDLESTSMLGARARQTCTGTAYMSKPSSACLTYRAFRVANRSARHIVVGPG